MRQIIFNPKWQEGKIYRLFSPSTGQCYVGSTTRDLSWRKSKHCCDYKRHQNGLYGYMTSYKIVEAGDPEIELLENVTASCRQELIDREKHWVSIIANTVNKIVPC